MSRGGNQAGRIGFGFGRVGLSKFHQKNLLGHGSGRISDRMLLVFFGSRIISGSYELISFRVSGHSDPDRVGSSFGSSDIG
jgi:hypothetical protein